ncbi:zinc-dependent alcohol dehydrogenase family protein [Mycolicibacterium smegmatis]|jgi:D-arabinitol dehydrogenase (NADP+)|uniref:2-deoxy-scyllo-inosamine dehydrogenase n=3 Tax=Mycolicibacterium smegmatis TaxID=1772 RepID=A0QS68_MYCS2|nr:zinc-dependent alcohol dehydrogenase family protein [Mycolicibacterium smegmatis]ABK71633.1 2-deoxy-scyllo-inosamine dehydrogenase [Mycolicibacterium smegmatis MC2 155]AIU06609.1 2-deoxy-scyllo-inosamine dehydrogenase [Mycolicibacterium smegmatis MC2 155]AIU13234.1 2-deoxy-scyllo-inosamine dehydrogenase [Mycolicibacterium smegmatis]AIU19858.1 2-deoxy-scyllo-inosamine dehydrogenase [Mycolicibacterium smegmatis]AWT52373.1 2-deoxy-scyllo-inosamine dehydrogenase [Mycolicibacterium smegmatis MKD
MKAVLYEAPKTWSVTDVPTPQPGKGEVRIRVAQVGVCGTDLHIHDGEFGAVFPLIPGHELVGVVDAVGEGVTRFGIGEQVTVNPNVYCGQCPYCLAGRLGQCAAMLGYGSNFPGFFAEYAIADHTLVFSTEGLPLDTAVFSEPTACAMHGLESLQMRPGGSALVLGAGPTGLLLAQLIAAGGASSVTVAGPTQAKLDTASALGIDRTVRISRDDPEGNIAALMAASPHGDGYDAVVEATGSPAVGDICVPLARRGGTVLIYGVTREDDLVRFHPFDVFRREITIKGSFAEMTSFGAAIDALRGGRVRTDGIITHRFALDDYGRALEALRSDPAVHKVVIVP